MIYLDNAATTPISPEVLAVLTDSLECHFANPSSVYQEGKKTKRLLTEARESIQNYFELPNAHLYFTSGATEANNWAIVRQAQLAQISGKGNHIVSTAIEHPSVLNVLAHLETQGFEVTYIQPNDQQQFSVDQFIQATRNETIGWIMMAVNNEVGSRLPFEIVGQAAFERGLWFHIDAVQMIGHMKIDWNNVPFTTMVASAHKFNGPKGIGFLLYQPLNTSTFIEPLLYGGGQEKGLRSGTENIPYIIAMDHALHLDKHNIEHYIALSEHLYQVLNEADIEYERNGDMKNSVPYIHNLWIKNHSASQLLILLDLENVAISAGSACSAGSLQPSDTLKAYYPEQSKRWSESLRISFGIQTTKEEITQFVKKLSKIID